MKTPDKIYIHRTIHLGLLSASEIDITGQDEQYIRKDALMEWAKEHYDKFKFLYNIKRASVVYDKMDTYKEMIDKIESL